MPFMILAHPRSKSNLLSHCFKNNMGGIFNIKCIDKETYEIIPPQKIDMRNAVEVWKEPWAKEYLKYLEKKMTEVENIAFKVFFEHVASFPEGLDLIKRINPKVIHIYRKDSLKAIKSLLIAGRRGYTKAQERPYQAFTVDYNEFLSCYHQCVTNPEMGRSTFKIEWSSTYEDFDPNAFPYAEKIPCIQPQNSEEVFSSIINEDQINDWFHLQQSF